MRRTFIATIGLLLATCSVASAQVLIWHPPAKFNHRHRGVVVEHRQSWQNTRSLCDRIVAHTPTLSGYHSRPDACQWWVGRRCHIAIPVGRDVTREETIAYRKHETAHCNGWGDNHAGGF